MKCVKCNCNLTIASSKITFEGDTSADTETKAFNNLTMVCVNPLCAFYGGGRNTEDNPLPLELDNPKVVAECLKQPMN